MLINKECTNNLEKALGYIDSFIEDYENRKLARELTEYAFSLNGFFIDNSLAIKCYKTGKPDIRFCIDRGSDCEQRRTMTNFLCIKSPCEIYVIAKGTEYLRPQNNTDFRLILSNDAKKEVILK